MDQCNYTATCKHCQKIHGCKKKATADSFCDQHATSKKTKPGVSTHYGDGDWITPKMGKDENGRFSTDWLGMKIQY